MAGQLHIKMVVKDKIKELEQVDPFYRNMKLSDQINELVMEAIKARFERNKSLWKSENTMGL